MNCPGCGRFMKLVFAREIGRNAMESAFWWVCGNEYCPQCDQRIPIPANEYDWLYWCDGIPLEELKADPELNEEYQEALKRYWNRPTARRMRRG